MCARRHDGAEWAVVTRGLGTGERRAGRVRKRQHLYSVGVD